MKIRVTHLSSADVPMNSVFEGDNIKGGVTHTGVLIISGWSNDVYPEKKNTTIFAPGRWQSTVQEDHK